MTTHPTDGGDKGVGELVKRLQARAFRIGTAPGEVDGITAQLLIDAACELERLRSLASPKAGERAGVEWPETLSDEAIDAARGAMQLLRGKPGVSFGEIKEHCRRRGDDLSVWPQWADDNAVCYVTEHGAANLICSIMRAAHVKATSALPLPPDEGEG